jgi:Flp pilus assembly protein TadD
VNLDSADAESFYSIGALHEQRGNGELAARAYARVVELEPGHALAQQGLGLAFFEARRFDEAKASLQRAVALDPMLWRAHDSLGIIADKERQHDLAVRHYTSAIEARPTLASIHNNRGYSKYLSGALEAAKRDFLTALELDPDYERAWRNLGLVLARQQDYDRALGAMSRSIAKHVALNDIGYIAMLDGNYRVAQAFFEEAVIVSPRHYQIAKDNLVELSRRRSLQASTAN